MGFSTSLPPEVTHLGGFVRKFSQGKDLVADFMEANHPWTLFGIREMALDGVTNVGPKGFQIVALRENRFPEGMCRIAAFRIFF
jgi:hypothetical protein